MHPVYAAPCAPNERCLLVLFDLRCPGAEQRLRRELAAWRGFAVTEKLHDHHAVLVVRPGGAGVRGAR
jgi:hypothetical protein